MKKLLLTLMIVAALGANVCTAAPLNQKHIPTDAQWGFHLNMEAFWGSEMGKLIRKDVEAKYSEKIAALEQLLGSDISTDLKGITLYGTSADHESASVLVYGNYNKEKLTSLLVLNEAYRKSEYEGKTIHHWLDDKSQEPQCGAFAADDLIVISPDEDSLKAALDTLAGYRQTLADEYDLPLKGLTKIDDNVIAVVAAVSLPNLLQGNQEAAILNNCKMMAMVIAEDDGDMKLQLDLTAQTAEAAIQIEQALLGLKAFILLNQNSCPELPKVIQDAILTRDENQLSLEIGYPSAKLFDLLKKLEKDETVQVFIEENQP